MKKETHFRIVELEDVQVLLTKDWNDDDDENPIIVLTMFWDGVKVENKLGYESEKIRDEVFDTVKDSKIKEMADAIKNMIE